MSYLKIVVTWWEELAHRKRPWCWEGLGAGGEGDDRGWDGWMVSLTQCTWVWANSGRWWRTGKSSMLQSMGLQRDKNNWATELNWTESFATTVKMRNIWHWLWNQFQVNILKDLSFNGIWRSYLKRQVCLLEGIMLKDTTKPKSNRRKDLLHAASKEKTGDLSQIDVSPTAKFRKF